MTTRRVHNEIGGTVADEIEELLDELARPTPTLESDDRPGGPATAGEALHKEGPDRARSPASLP